MTWLPRIRFSGFGPEQIKELVSNWLDRDETMVSTFFAQLRVANVLSDMMDIPLLATLIVLVFKQTGKLPENKTRLYEMFVDLHNGGWDLAKGVQRPSRFSAAEKMFIPKRIAASRGLLRKCIPPNAERCSKSNVKPSLTKPSRKLTGLH